MNCNTPLNKYTYKAQRLVEPKPSTTNTLWKKQHSGTGIPIEIPESGQTPSCFSHCGEIIGGISVFSVKYAKKERLNLIHAITQVRIETSKALNG